MADKTDSPHTSHYEIHPPEGITLPPGRTERWSDLFRHAGLSPEQARDVQGWYWLLNEDAKAHQVEREVLRPQEIAALTERQRTLMQKRHGPAGLTPRELQELMATNERLRALQDLPNA
jgi:hypothetical protein